MPNTISAQERTLGDVLSNRYRFSVPDFQRPYAWEWEQAQDMFDDICDASKDATRLGQVESLDPYFLGCVVLVKSDDSTDSEIVDGQQRLTTLTMLFCALRDSMSPEWFEALNGMVRQQANLAHGRPSQERLTIRSEDVDFFRTRVQEPGSLSSNLTGPSPHGDTQTRLLGNAQGLFKLVQGLTHEKREVLARYLTKKCYLVVVATADTASAVRIFGILHTRGLDLSPTDVIKSEVASHLQDNSRSTQMRRWQENEENLGRENFRRLFSHIYSIKKRERSRKSLEEVFVQDVLGGGRDCENFVSDTLVRYADLFDKLVTTGFPSAHDSTVVLHSLRRVNNTDWIPPALHFVERRGDSQGALVEFLRLLERLAYSMLITPRTYSVQRLRRYIEVMNEIDNDIDFNDSGSRIQLTADEKQQMLENLRGDVSMKWARPVLLRLDGIGFEGGVEYRHDVVSVEHVLPQSPRGDSEWMTWFPDEDSRMHWTWKLGNLVLLSRRKNAAAGNKGFDDKKETYFETGNETSFRLTQSLHEIDEWTPEVLERRQEDLVGRLAEEWQLTD